MMPLHLNEQFAALAIGVLLIVAVLAACLGGSK